MLAGESSDGFPETKDSIGADRPVSDGGGGGVAKKSSEVFSQPLVGLTTSGGFLTSSIIVVVMVVANVPTAGRVTTLTSVMVVAHVSSPLFVLNVSLGLRRGS